MAEYDSDREEWKWVEAPTEARTDPDAIFQYSSYSPPATDMIMDIDDLLE